MAETALRYLIDSYLDWSKAEGIPIVDAFAVDLTAVETKPWPRLGDGVRGALVHLKGRGDFIALQVIVPSCIFSLRKSSMVRPISLLWRTCSE